MGTRAADALDLSARTSAVEVVPLGALNIGLNNNCARYNHDKLYPREVLYDMSQIRFRVPLRLQ